jgi:3',5'-cyclic AMP phosphodiesterase CpdA
MRLIVHVSDFHLGDDPRKDARLRAVLDHVGVFPRRPDALLVTGDVLDDPTIGDYPAIGRQLSAIGVPIVACPGNHDDRAGFRRLLGIEGGDVPVNSRLRLGDDLTIVACDSSVRGVDWGALADETLAWLERELVAAETPVLVALHHHPVPVGIPYVDALMLREPGRLEAVLRGSPALVVGVVCGHAHTATSTRFAGLPLVVCPAVSSTILTGAESVEEIAFAPDAPAFLCLHLLDGDRLTSHVRSC